jgi:cysteine desulfurase
MIGTSSNDAKIISSDRLPVTRMSLMKKPIYLDFNATTPLDPRVLEAMIPYFHAEFGNSVSAAHSYGWTAEKAVNKAREQVADLIHCDPLEVFFTAGATESNNWVIRGLADQLKLEGFANKPHFITSCVEHSSVVNAMKSVEALGLADVSWVEVQKNGVISLADLQAKLKKPAQLMSLMWVNNEIGSINPMKTLTAEAKAHQTYLHTDATQAIGKVPVDLQETPVDLLSFSGHKIYGPKGAGVLFVRSKNPKVQLRPLLHGGGHERGARSGTLNVPAIVGLGEACALIKQTFQTETVRLVKLRDSLWGQIHAAFPEARLNGPNLGDRVANNLNISFVGYQVPPSFADIAVSRGSACQSGSTSVSPVLKAIGLTEAEADRTLRLSLGRDSTEQDIDLTVQTLKKTLRRL